MAKVRQSLKHPCVTVVAWVFLVAWVAKEFLVAEVVRTLLWQWLLGIIGGTGC